MHLQPNRVGTSYEYKYGHYYLTITDFHDGHCEIEIHRCVPEQLYHSCDMKDINDAKRTFESLINAEMRSRILLPNGEFASGKNGMSVIDILKENEFKILER